MSKLLYYIYINKCMNPFFLEQHINIINTHSFKAFGRSVLCNVVNNRLTHFRGWV